jgi:hypothetical protein
MSSVPRWLPRWLLDASELVTCPGISRSPSAVLYRRKLKLKAKLQQNCKQFFIF